LLETILGWLTAGLSGTPALLLEENLAFLLLLFTLELPLLHLLFVLALLLRLLRSSLARLVGLLLTNRLGRFRQSEDACGGGLWL
jgi:hypothetical protein